MVNLPRPLLSPATFGKDALFPRSPLISQWEICSVVSSMVLGDCPQLVQAALNHLAAEATTYGMRFPPSKCKVIFEDWHRDPHAFILCRESLKIISPGVSISSGQNVADEISLRISKARLTFANLSRLRRRRTVRIVFNAVVRSVLIYGCEPD